MKLQELAIYGVNKVSQMLKIDIPEVVFLSESEIPNKNLIGSFIPEEYLIVFNKDLILASEPMNIIITCFHEVRHAYQYLDRKSTRLNSSHVRISYAVFCLKKKNKI